MFKILKKVIFSDAQSIIGSSGWPHVWNPWPGTDDYNLLLWLSLSWTPICFKYANEWKRWIVTMSQYSILKPKFTWKYWSRFHQRFMSGFYTRRSQKRKNNTFKLSVFFALLGSEHLKAVGKTMIKLTPDGGCHGRYSPAAMAARSTSWRWCRSGRWCRDSRCTTERRRRELKKETKILLYWSLEGKSRHGHRERRCMILWRQYKTLLLKSMTEREGVKNCSYFVTSFMEDPFNIVISV